MLLLENGKPRNRGLEKKVFSNYDIFSLKSFMLLFLLARKIDIK